MAAPAARHPEESNAGRQVRKGAQKAAATARRASRASERVASNPVLEILARAGYVVRGVLYGTMGLVGLQMAIGRTAHGADQKGTLAVYAGSGIGHIVLVVFAVALAAYSLWGFVRAVHDPLQRGDDPAGLAARAGFAWSGIAYAGLVLAIVQVLLGSSGLSNDSVQSAVQRALSAPLGAVATGIAGVIAIVMGLGQFVDAYKATFKSDLKRSEMEKPEYQAAMFFGRFGMLARGVVFTITGWFVVQAALHHDASRAHNMGAAFDTLLAQPLGHLLTAVVALGFIALALHSLACARWVRML